MRIILILLLRLSLFYCDKLDRTYLPPPGSAYSGGRTDDLQPPFVINQTPGFPQQNYVPDIKNGNDYNRPIGESPRDRNFFNGPRDPNNDTYQERNRSSPNLPNQYQQGQNKSQFVTTVSPSVTSSTVTAGKPSYSQFGPDSFTNPAFRPGSYNIETAQPGRLPSDQTQVINNGRYNTPDDSKRPQTYRYSNISNQPNNQGPYNSPTDGSERPETNRFPSVPSHINDNRQYGPLTGDLNDFKGNYGQPTSTTNAPNLFRTPNVQYEINQKDQYPSINEFAPQPNAPGRIINDQALRPQVNLKRPQDKGQLSPGNIPSFQPNSPINRPSYLSEISNSPSFNTSSDSLKPTSIFPNYPGTYQPNYQNNTGNINTETTTPAGSITSYPGTDNARSPAVYKRPERPQSAQERNAVILDYTNVLTPEGFEYSFDTSNGIHADEKGTALDGVKAKGSFSYTGDDGKYYQVIYSADENGFRPSGDHLPTPPPIPEAIQRVIEEAEKNRAAGVVHDGFYDDRKYGHKKYDKTRNRNKPKKPRPESDKYDVFDNDDDQGISNPKQNPQKYYFQDSDNEEYSPEREYESNRQNGKPGVNFDDELDGNERVINERKPIKQGQGQKQNDNRIPQNNQRGQQGKPFNGNTSGYTKKQNNYKYSQKQPGKIINQQFAENEPESGEDIIDEISYDRGDDQDESSYPAQDNISIYDAQGKAKEKSNANRPEQSNKLDKPIQKNKATRPRTEIRERTRILSKKPQNNKNNLPSDDQYQNQRPKYDLSFVNKPENINDFDDDSREKEKYKNDEFYDRQPSFDEKYYKNEADQQDYDFIEPENDGNKNTKYGEIGFVPKAPYRRNKTKEGGYAYLPPNKQFYYETTTSSTRKPDYKDVKTTQNDVYLDLEAPNTTQRPYTRYSTFKPSQNRLVATTDRPSTQQPSFDRITGNKPFVQETNKRVFNVPGKIVTIKPADKFVESSTKPYSDQTRPSPKDENYPYYTDTYQGTTPKTSFQQKTSLTTYGTTTPSPAIFEQTQIDQNYPFKPQNVGTDYTSQQQIYTTENPKLTYETGYKSTTYRPNVRPGPIYENNRPDTQIIQQDFIPERNQGQNNFKTPNQFIEQERYPTKEKPGYNKYEIPTPFQQSTTRQDYIPGVTRLPSKTPGFDPNESERTYKTKTTTTYPRYQTTQSSNIPVKVTEDTTKFYGNPNYEPSPNQPRKDYPNYPNDRKELQQDKLRRPAFGPTTVYPSTFGSIDIKGTQTTKIYPDSQTDYPDTRKDTNNPYPQNTYVFSPDARPRKPTDVLVTQGVPSTSEYSEPQNVNYPNKENEYTQNQPISRPSNKYPGFKPTQSQVIQDNPRNVTRVISTDRTRPGSNRIQDINNNPNVEQDPKFGGGKPQNIPREYYSQAKPKEDRSDGPRKPTTGTFSSQSRPRIPQGQESQDLPEINLSENRPSIGSTVYPSNYNPGQNRNINSSYTTPAPEIIGEDFSGPKQPSRFDPKTGYHY